MPDQERPWVRILGALILGGAGVLTAMIPLYCAKDNRLVQTTSAVQSGRAEIDSLKQALARDTEVIAGKDAEIVQLRRRTTAAADCPPAVTPQTGQEASAEKNLAESAPTPFVRSAVEREVQFGLQGCHLSGTTLTCSMLITSRGGDRGLILRYYTNRSRAIDPAGREVRATRFTAGIKHCDACDVEASLPTDVPIAAQVVFDGLQPTTRHIQLIEITCSVQEPTGNWHDALVKFSNFDL